MPAVNAGELRSRVTIETPSVTVDEIGGRVQAWTPVATVWAAVEPMSAGEQWRRLQIDASANWKITIRWMAGVSPKQRVRYGARVFEIKGVTDPDQRRRFVELACEETHAT